MISSVNSIIKGEMSTITMR